MPTIKSYLVTLVRSSGKVSTMRVLALTLADAQAHAERMLIDFVSLTVEVQS